MLLVSLNSLSTAPPKMMLQRLMRSGGGRQEDMVPQMAGRWTTAGIDGQAGSS